MDAATQGSEPTANFDASAASLAECREELGARLRAAMTERGWTQKDVVAASGMRKDQVSVYARGLQMPRPEAMTRLASAFGVHEEALLPGIGRRRSGGAGHDVYILDAVPGAPDLMRIHLRRVLPARVALRIASLVSESGGGFG